MDSYKVKANPKSSLIGLLISGALTGAFFYYAYNVETNSVCWADKNSEKPVAAPTALAPNGNAVDVSNNF